MPEVKMNLDEMNLEKINDILSKPEVFRHDERLKDSLVQIDKWERKMEAGGYTIEEGLLFGEKSFGEYLEEWDADAKNMSKEEKVRLAAFIMYGLDRSHGLEDRLSPPTTAILPIAIGIDSMTMEERGYKGPQSAGNERKSQYLELTGWDKFWSFFGITTSRVRYNEMLDQTKEATREKAQQLNRVKETKGREREAFLKNNREAYENSRKYQEKIREQSEQWQQLFFGEGTKPNSFRFLYGGEISPVAACIGFIQRSDPEAAMTMIQMTPEEIGKDRKLMEYVNQAANLYLNLKKEERELLQDEVSDGLMNHGRLLDLEERLTAMMIPTVETNFDVVPEGKENLTREDALRYAPMIQAKQELGKILGKKGGMYKGVGFEENVCWNYLEQSLNTKRQYEAMGKCEYDKADALGRAVMNAEKQIQEYEGEMKQKQPEIEEPILEEPVLEEPVLEESGLVK